jgi:hypothetical protein
MPLILHPEDLDRWLAAPFDELLEMQTAYPTQLCAPPHASTGLDERVHSDAYGDEYDRDNDNEE